LLFQRWSNPVRGMLMDFLLYMVSHVPKSIVVDFEKSVPGDDPQDCVRRKLQELSRNGHGGGRRARHLEGLWEVPVEAEMLRKSPQTGSSSSCCQSETRRQSG
jgi:hypothetical protein